LISGINHITFAVSDLDRSFHFYSQLLGLRPIARWYKGAYLEAGTDWVCLTLDPETRAASLPEYTHTAFTVSTPEFSRLVEQLQKAQVICWQDNRSPGASFYFLDPDGHKLEIHVSNLEDRLRSLKANPPKDLTLFADGN
jgi:catechol 2,3-dioxygenase-like lactoylglutathione lyase family enzyme